MADDQHSPPPTLAGAVVCGMAIYAHLAYRIERYTFKRAELEAARAKYPTVIVHLPGPDPAAIVRAVAQALHDNGVAEDEVHAFVQDALSEDYPHLLVTVARWVETL